MDKFGDWEHPYNEIWKMLHKKDYGKLEVNKLDMMVLISDMLTTINFTLNLLKEGSQEYRKVCKERNKLLELLKKCSHKDSKCYTKHNSKVHDEKYKPRRNSF